MGLVLRVGSSYCSTQPSTQVPSLTSKNCCHVGHPCHFRDLGPRMMWQVPTSVLSWLKCIDWLQVTWDLGLWTLYEPTLRIKMMFIMNTNWSYLTNNLGFCYMQRGCIYLDFALFPTWNILKTHTLHVSANYNVQVSTNYDLDLWGHLVITLLFIPRSICDQSKI